MAALENIDQLKGVIVHELKTPHALTSPRFALLISRETKTAYENWILENFDVENFLSKLREKFEVLSVSKAQLRLWYEKVGKKDSGFHGDLEKVDAELFLDSDSPEFNKDHEYVFMLLEHDHVVGGVPLHDFYVFLIRGLPTAPVQPATPAAPAIDVKKQGDRDGLGTR